MLHTFGHMYEDFIYVKHLQKLAFKLASYYKLLMCSFSNINIFETCLHGHIWPIYARDYPQHGIMCFHYKVKLVSYR